MVERVELVTDPGAIAGPSTLLGAGGDADVLQAALAQFYEMRVPPGEINLPADIEDCEAMEEWLSARAGRRVKILVPQRGDKRCAGGAGDAQRRARLPDAVQRDHRRALRRPRDAAQCHRAAVDSAAHRLLRHLDHPGQRDRGLDGRVRRRADEEERVQEVQDPGRVDHDGIDDFAAMREVVQRRYRKILEEGGPFPDLILIDGGRGQLSAAYDALEQIGLGNLVAVGIAKKEEVLFTRERPEPIVLPEHDPALLLIQRIRDEAHRFAVTFHRKARSMRDLRSQLDEVPGIGPRRRKALLTTFGSLAGVRRATREELESVVGARAASAVIDYFARST